MQIAGAIRAAIRSGELAPGEMLPSENEIARQSGTSRSAAGHALRLLREEGLIYSVPRRGSFVAARDTG